LDERVNERTRIARELHDTLLQSFQALALRFQTALNVLPDRPAEAKARLAAALERADDAIAEGRNAIQGLRDSTTEKNNLAAAIRTFGDALTNESPATTGVAFSVAVEGESQDLHPIIRDEIYNVAAEALRNAFRHARARTIGVVIQYERQYFRLLVTDDGKGIERALLTAGGTEGHYGLRGMSERAALLGGELAVGSEVGVGTEVGLRLPARIAYARSRRRSWLSRRLAAKTPAQSEYDAS
jgi:signal transduction histidine kinase